MPDVQDDTGVLLGHTHQAEVVRRFGGGEETYKGVVLKENHGAPSFEELKELHGGHTTLDRRVAAVGRRLEEIPRKGGVLVKDEDYLVTVEPPEPLTRVDGAEG